jgi:hypothetical protein
MMAVNSFFDVFFDVTITDVDPVNNYFGNIPVFSLQDQSDPGTRDMSTTYQAIFDAQDPNYGLLPPPQTFPYIGHFNIVIPLPDINGTNGPDVLKFTFAAHTVNDVGRTFIVLPDGTVVDSFDSSANLAGAIMDDVDDPPFSIDMIGPGQAHSLLLNDVVPEPSAILLLAGGALASVAHRRKRA